LLFKQKKKCFDCDTVFSQSPTCVNTTVMYFSLMFQISSRHCRKGQTFNKMFTLHSCSVQDWQILILPIWIKDIVENRWHSPIGSTLDVHVSTQAAQVS